MPGLQRGQWRRSGLRGGTRTIGAATFTGTGPVHVSASLDVADPVSLPNLQLDSGSLAGPATLTVTGTLGLNGTNSNALTGAHLINKGVATETGDYIGLNNSSVLENAGTLNLTDGFEIFSNDTTANQLENDASGTINYTGSTASSTTSISVSTTNNGLISVTKGTLTDTELTNLVSGTLTGGSYNATNGTINVGAVITTNAANITLGGLAGLIGNGSASALSTLKTNSGTLTLNGRGLSVLAALTNSGTITLTTGTLQVSSFTQSGGRPRCRAQRC